MEFESMLSKMGPGMKHLTDRYAEYNAPVSDQHLLYADEPPAQAHEAASKHHGHGGHKSNAAMSALTLLAFLFFLHILQQCIKEHTIAMNTPQITIMTGAREGDTASKKADAKIDKYGVTASPEMTEESYASKRTKKTSENEKLDVDKTYLFKINTAEPPRNSGTYSRRVTNT
ncbi:hypothetical protein ACJJTC_009476 [Scirpophaga incertulas]